MSATIGGNTHWQRVRWYLRDGAALGREIHSSSEAPSTQLAAKEAAHAGAPHGAVFVTDYQSAGRGRRDRGWVSRPGVDLTFSVVLRPSVETRYAHMLSLAAALSVGASLGKILPPDRIGIKWPNDVLANGKKLCGIICESAHLKEGLAYAVLGIGVNVNGARGGLPSSGSPDKPEATSVFLELDRKTNLPELLADILTELEHYAPMIDSPEGRGALIGLYRKNCVTIGRDVRVISEDGEFIGVASGVDDDGALLLGPGESARAFRAADVVHARLV